jgi:hypothetical protein
MDAEYVTSAKMEVRETLARYNMAADSGRLDEVVATFMAGGVLENRAWRVTGRAAIREKLQEIGRSLNPKLTVSRHHLTTCLIDIPAPDRAVSRTYFLVVTDIGPDHSGVYTDALRLLDGQWLFETRRVRLDWAAPNTLFALDDLNGSARANRAAP